MDRFVNQLGDTLGAPLPPYPEPDAILLYIRDGAVLTLRWEQPEAIGGQGQYFLTRSDSEAATPVVTYEGVPVPRQPRRRGAALLLGHLLAVPLTPASGG